MGERRNLTEAECEAMTIREIAATSKLGWLSPAIWTRLGLKEAFKRLPLPEKLRRKIPVLRKVEKWPDAKERLEEILAERNKE